jgi:hypothetical protein
VVTGTVGLHPQVSLLVQTVLGLAPFSSVHGLRLIGWWLYIGLGWSTVLGKSASGAEPWSDAAT